MSAMATRSPMGTFRLMRRIDQYLGPPICVALGLLQAVAGLLRRADAVLLKGSRGMGLERIVHALRDSSSAGSGGGGGVGGKGVAIGGGAGSRPQAMRRS